MRRMGRGQSPQVKSYSFRSGKATEITHLEGIELYVGVAVGKTLDQGLNCLLGAVGIAGHAIADLHYGAPVLRGEVLVRRLG